MKEYSAKRLDRSRDAIEGARRDLAADAPRFAADHAYYAMFYAAEALLADRDLGFSSHGRVHGAFGKEFAKTAALDPKYHGWLLDAFKERQSVTYGTDPEISAGRALEMIEHAEEFRDAARKYLEVRE